MFAKDYKGYRFKQVDNDNINIVKLDTNEEHLVSKLEAMNFYNDLVTNNTENIDKNIRIKNFLSRALVQYTHNIITWCKEDYASEWSSNTDISINSELKEITIGYYFDNIDNQGDYIQIILYPINTNELGYGFVLQILYCDNIIRELQATTNSITNFNKLNDEMPPRCVLTLADIDDVAPNIICNDMQKLIFKVIAFAIEDLNA